mgnify:CR=1 FL=1
MMPNFLQLAITQILKNLVISFDYSWFLAKNLSIMKFHYQNSSTVHIETAATHPLPPLFLCITLICFRVQFPMHLFPKQVTGQELIFAVSYSKLALAMDSSPCPS